MAFRGRDDQLVGEVDRVEDRHQVVVTVGSDITDREMQVDLRRRPDPDGGGRRGQR